MLIAKENKLVDNSNATQQNKQTFVPLDDKSDTSYETDHGDEMLDQDLDPDQVAELENNFGRRK